uniref:Uncharacterized protein n=1 Tax=Tanacetum cinerariifolium TaxID=118510 RepID=A0A699IBV2_TANCI|nr:hypothetical protein [Tanacetum cinerariifolium]
MSRSDPGEMAPESSQLVVIPKFDMHVYTSTLTLEELNVAIKEFSIPLELGPRILPPKLTINKLSDDVIGDYIEFEGLEEKVFFIDWRAISHAMSWRHTNTDVRDDFPISYNECDVDRIAECVILIRNLPTPLLYMCELTMNYRHPELSHVIKDAEGKALKKKRARKNVGITSSGSKDLIFAAPINHSIPKPLNTIAGSKGKEAKAFEDDQVKKVDVLDEMILHLATPPKNKVLNSLTNYEVLRRTYQSMGRSILSQAKLFEQLNRDYMDLSNRSDVQMEELNHLRSDYVRERQSNEGLSKNLVLLKSAHGKCSDRERDLSDMIKDMEREQDEWRQTSSDQVEKIKNLKGDLGPKSKQLSDAEERVRVVEYRKSLVIPTRLCFTAGWLKGLGLGREEDEIADILTITINLYIEGSKVWKDKHCELFTFQCPYIQKIADAYLLSVDELMKVSHDIPPHTKSDEVGTSVKNNDDGLAKPASPKVQLTKGSSDQRFDPETKLRRESKRDDVTDDDILGVDLTPVTKQIPEKSNHQKVGEYENERVLAAKRKYQWAKDRAVKKRAATEGASQRTKKKKKMAPLSFALSDSEEDDSGTHHSASPLNAIIPNKAGPTTRGGSMTLESVNHEEKGSEQRPKNVEKTTEANSPLSEHSHCSQHSNPSEEDAHDIRDETAHTHPSGLTGRVSSSSGGSHRQAFPRRNPVVAPYGATRTFRALPPRLDLTTYSILNDVESCRDMMIHLATPAIRDQQN